MDRHQVYTHLKNLGFNPTNIVDCGAAWGEWSSLIKNIFTESFIIGIDANKWTENKIPGTDITEIAVLSNIDNKEMFFYRAKEYLNNNTFSTGDSLFIEDSHHYKEDNTVKNLVKTKTLSSILKEHSIFDIGLLKIDTQGSEILIMQGLGDSLNSIEFIELEVSLVNYNINGCLFNDVIDFLKNRFDIYDIVELHRHNEYYLCQLDIIFQNKQSKIKKIK
jgi:FkbM family methyltransferase